MNPNPFAFDIIDVDHWLVPYVSYFGKTMLEVQRKDNKSKQLVYVYLPYIELINRIEDEMKPCEGTLRLVDTLRECYKETISYCLKIPSYRSMLDSIKNEEDVTIAQAKAELMYIMYELEETYDCFGNIFLHCMYKKAEDLERYGIKLFTL